MGCCSSSAIRENIELNETLGGYGSKRKYSSRISWESSSGISSASSSPSTRRSVLSRCTTSAHKQKGSPGSLSTLNTLHFKRKEVTRDTKQFSVCDDFSERAQLPQEQQQRRHQEYNSRSCGYFSESMSTDSAAATPTKSLLRTQDISLRDSSSDSIAITSPTCSLEMEMYMMSHSDSLVAKTSSPVFDRRDLTFDAASTKSSSYQRWCHYLQTKPTYVMQNVTNLPEAIAGHFSPSGFPGFSDLEEMDSAAKRYKVDTDLPGESYHVPVYIKRTVSTDL